jgi:hypothetical protein
MEYIGITERGDAALDTSWLNWVNKGKAAILITKNPIKLRDILFERVPVFCYKNIILHCTVTGMGGTYLEPNVPKYEDIKDDLMSLKTDFELKGFSLAKLVLRADPIIPVSPALDAQLKVIEELSSPSYFDEVRISFIDNYYHNRDKISLPWEGLHAPLEMRQEAYDKIKNVCNLPLNVCGEPGFKCNGCVSESDILALGRKIEDYSLALNGQRQFCSCIAAKKELLSNKHPCGHNCAYCYWKK